MTELLDGVMAGKRRDSFVGEETARLDMLEAERLLEAGLGNMGLSEAEDWDMDSSIKIVNVLKRRKA
ncbi:MAG: hypothetical protein DRP64_01520 [Verrucomicrobia bacterium]|nr:MAG: hypothetical protein DRP64_01520 [Verrucomicrobiota bacterium]